MTETVNVGIIGGGLMGREVAAALQRWPALVDHPVRPRLTAVCDINPAAMDWFRQIDTVTTFTTDAAELLARDDVDVVYIAVRHDLHRDLYVQALHAGKDLLAEKPFGIDEAAAGQILEAIEETRRFVRVSSEMPFFPGAQWVIDYARSGAPGRLISVRSGFLHSSDLDPTKPINWKRQARYCGQAGVMNDLGMHAWHVPLRLGWQPSRLTAHLQDLVPQRPGPSGSLVPCDTWENAAIRGDLDGVALVDVHVDRVAPGNKNTWYLEVIGMDGGARFSTADPKKVEVFGIIDVPGVGREQSWQALQAGSQSVWPTVTGGIFEFGFSDAILQMWAAFLADRAGMLGGRFGCATPEEALTAHRLAAAASESHLTGQRVAVATHADP